MKSFISCALALASLVPTFAWAQPVLDTPYVRFSESHTYVDLVNPTVLFTNALTSSTDVALPFAFTFYDRTHTTVSAGTDGAIIFAAGQFVSNLNALPGTPTAPNGFIAPFWDTSQFCAADMGHLAVQMQGAAPNRVAVFEWRRLNMGGCSPADLVSYQLRLHEGTSGRIEIDYGPTVNFTGSTLSATMGMEDETGARPVFFPTCTGGTACGAANFISGTRVTIVKDRGVDLEATKIEAPAFMPLDVARRVQATVKNNNGTALGPIDVSLFATSVSTPSPVLIGATTVSLAGYATETVSIDATPPSALGTDRVDLVLIIDPSDAVTEVDEVNNRFVSPTPVRLVPANPDYAIAVVSVDRTDVREGDAVTITARLDNVGTAGPGVVDASVVLSSNPVISGGDFELTRSQVTIGAQSSTALSFEVTIPTGIASGTYYVGVVADPNQQVDELSESNNGAPAPSPLTISGASIQIVSQQLPSARVREPYVAVIQTLGAVGNTTFVIVTGQLPQGIGIVPSTGELFGRSVVPGCEDFTVRVTDEVASDEAMFRLCVVDPPVPLTVVVRDLPIATVGQGYEAVLVVTGGDDSGQRTWSATSLPPGLMVSPDGRLFGTPTTAGVYLVEVSVSDSAGTVSRTLELEVVESARLNLVSRPLMPAKIDTPYADRFEVSGALGDVVYTIEFGRLPDGVVLMADGRLEGTPRVAGSFFFAVRVRETVSGAPASDVDAFTLRVDDGEDLTIITPTLPDGMVGATYDANLEADGGLAPYDWTIVEGRLPEGIVASVDLTTGSFRFVGTPTSSDLHSLLIQVEDAQGRLAKRALSIQVLEREVPPEEPKGCRCVRGPTRWTWLLLLLMAPLLRRR